MINPYSFKKCPFCASDRIKVMREGDEAAWCECSRCHARGPAVAPMGSGEHIISNARDAWNARKSNYEEASIAHAERCRAYKDAQQRICGHGKEE